MSLSTIVYPAKDLDTAKAVFTALLGQDPTTDSPYYVGYSVEGQEIGLDPNGHESGAVPYWTVPDVAAAYAGLLAAGALAAQEPHDVGGGGVIASVTLSGNLIGIKS